MSVVETMKQIHTILRSHGFARRSQESTRACKKAWYTGGDWDAALSELQAHVGGKITPGKRGRYAYGARLKWQLGSAEKQPPIDGGMIFVSLIKRGRAGELYREGIDDLAIEEL